MMNDANARQEHNTAPVARGGSPLLSHTSDTAAPGNRGGTVPRRS